MHPFPHHYQVHAHAATDGPVTVAAPGLNDLLTASPAEFGGPGDQWSPETMLVGAAVDCLILTFRAIATASNLAWTRIECDGEGVLDRVGGVTRFTEIRLSVRLDLPADGDRERALRLLEKSKSACLITNSLTATATLSSHIQLAAPA